MFYLNKNRHDGFSRKRSTVKIFFEISKERWKNVDEYGKRSTDNLWKW